MHGSLITLMIEAVSTSETSVSFYETTRRNIVEDGHLHAGRHENLKSYLQMDLVSDNSSLPFY
jgi:hypothetical protein